MGTPQRGTRGTSLAQNWGQVLNYAVAEGVTRKGKLFFFILSQTQLYCKRRYCHKLQDWLDNGVARIFRTTQLPLIKDSTFDYSETFGWVKDSTFDYSETFRWVKDSTFDYRETFDEKLLGGFSNSLFFLLLLFICWCSISLRCNEVVKSHFHTLIWMWQSKVVVFQVHCYLKCSPSQVCRGDAVPGTVYAKIDNRMPIFRPSVP